MINANQFQTVALPTNPPVGDKKSPSSSSPPNIFYVWSPILEIFYYKIDLIPSWVSRLDMTTSSLPLPFPGLGSQLTSYTVTWPVNNDHLLPSEGANQPLDFYQQLSWAPQEEKCSDLSLNLFIFCFQQSLIYDGDPNNTDS